MIATSNSDEPAHDLCDQVVMMIVVIVVMEVRVIMMLVTFALKTSRTSMQMLRLIVLFLRRNPNFLSSSLWIGTRVIITACE